jgi:hypothetical protein
MVFHYKLNHRQTDRVGEITKDLNERGYKLSVNQTVSAIIESSVAMWNVDRPRFYLNFMREQLERYANPQVGEPIPRPYGYGRPEE